MNANDLYTLPDSQEVEVQVIRDHTFYTEGPLIDANNHLLYTDLLGGSIWRWDGITHTLYAKGTSPNGQALLPTGNNVVCESQVGSVIEYDPKGKQVRLWAKGHMQNFEVRAPNDVIVDPEHGIYFTDSVRYVGAVYYVGFDGRSSVVADGIDYANGIVQSKDKSKLFVAESYKNRILEITLERPGLAVDKPVIFCDLPKNSNGEESGNLPDGLALDKQNRIWVAHYGMEAIQVISKEGQHLRTYATKIPLTSNLCFWGKDLVVTGGLGEPGPGRISLLRFYPEVS
ncbi:MAG: SMP-30/gluconolactonase/LRE family protein [Saprospiraceae bacterium]|nr:SMP-30/gluconolactonase/LRE family protein [Saprospiraceae bacterium]